ncbi:hypothetical protein CH252_04295 [Rhodococcus sp. 06-1477-1B]|nr:hypothetical protein CH252_04295 [Rhodococcus sp. 06-1477-1B]
MPPAARALIPAARREQFTPKITRRRATEFLATAARGEHTGGTGYRQRSPASGLTTPSGSEPSESTRPGDPTRRHSHGN